jgi:hypothetical protein
VVQLGLILNYIERIDRQYYEKLNVDNNILITLNLHSLHILAVAVKFRHVDFHSWTYNTTITISNLIASSR